MEDLKEYNNTIQEQKNRSIETKKGNPLTPDIKGYFIYQIKILVFPRATLSIHKVDLNLSLARKVFS